MNETRRPIFGFLWPTPDPRVDENAVQERLIRIPTRGMARVALLTLATLAVVMVSAGAVVAAVGTHVLVLIPTAALLATFWVLVMRAWSVGTFVNDRGIVIVALLRTRSARWIDVAAVRDTAGRVRLVLRDGRVMDTHISRWGLDLLGNTEGYDIARLALQRWGEQG